MTYTVKLNTGQPPDEWQEIRKTTSPDEAGAISLIEGFSQFANSRHGVNWLGEEVNENGDLFGHDENGVYWNIHVDPPLDS
jgi:hypothetical protein